MNNLKTLLLLTTASLSAMAQSMSVHQGGKEISFDLNDVDSVTFDQTPNLWRTADKHVSFYYAPGWNEIAAPSYTEEDGAYTVTLSRSTTAQWQAQMFIVSDLTANARKNYDFRLTLSSDKALTATVKLYQDGRDDLYFFEERVPLKAGEEVVFERNDMAGLDMSRVSLLIDFGGNRTGTTVKVSSIRFMERDYDSSLHQNSCPLPDYRLVWHDEFSSRVLNTTSRWTFQTAQAGWVNHELQTYVAGRSPKGGKVAEQTDGTLKIHTFREGDKIYSARLYGHKSVGFKYGYIEARIKLPRGKGTWPAWWMMPVGGSDWPACGEIDIMEEVGVDANIVSSSIHCAAYNHPSNTQKTHSMTCVGAEDGFHIYALEWTEDYIRTYVDGREQLYFENDHQGNPDTWPFDKAFYPILNVAWGGDWGGYAGVDETALPLTMEVDYVRIWQKK